MLPSPCFLISPVALALQTGTKISPVWRCWLLITQHVPLMEAACWEASCMTTNPALPLPPSPSSPRHTHTHTHTGYSCRQHLGPWEQPWLWSAPRMSRGDSHRCWFPADSSGAAVSLGPGSAGPDGCSGKGAAVWHWDLCCCHVPTSECWTLTLWNMES